MYAWCFWRPEDSVWSPETGVTDGVVYHHVCAGNSAQILWKNNQVLNG